MKINSVFGQSLLAAACLSLALPASAFDLNDPPLETPEGLRLVPDSKMALVYADPEADLSVYRKIYLVDATVAFRKNWERDQRRGSGSAMGIRSSDIEKIKDRLANEFNEVFRTELEEHGYEITDVAADDVMIVRPAIINLDVTAPDIPTAGRSRTYTQSAGEMTLYVELIDSVTGDTFVKAMDRKAERPTNYYTWSNSATNASAARRILRGWAEILREALEEARGDLSEE